MSAQIIELLFFAGIAFFLISKLISILGTTNENESHHAHTHRGSFFGEPKGIKDVTQVAPAVEVAYSSESSEYMEPKNASKIVQNLQVLSEKMPDFDLKKFVKGARVAFEMILGSFAKNDKKTFNSLVDPRFVENFEAKAVKYGICNPANLNAKISDIYMFGHTAFVKVRFTGSNALSKLDEINEEWIFTRNIAQTGPSWFLSNVETA